MKRITMNISKKLTIVALSLLIVPAHAAIDKKLLGGLVTGTALIGAAWWCYNHIKPKTSSLAAEGHLGFTEPYIMEISLDEESLRVMFEDVDNGIIKFVRIKRLPKGTGTLYYLSDAYSSIDAIMAYAPDPYMRPFIASDDFEIEDAQGNHLGKINCQLFTHYNVYDSTGTLIANASYIKGSMEVQINHNDVTIATLKNNTNTHWLMHVAQPTKIDPRILKFLGTLMVYHQFLIKQLGY